MGIVLLFIVDGSAARPGSGPWWTDEIGLVACVRVCARVWTRRAPPGPSSASHQYETQAIRLSDEPLSLCVSLLIDSATMTKQRGEARGHARYISAIQPARAAAPRRAPRLFWMATAYRTVCVCMYLLPRCGKRRFTDRRRQAHKNPSPPALGALPDEATRPGYERPTSKWAALAALGTHGT